MLPKTAVIGATGFIGRALLARYRAVQPDTPGTCRYPERKDLCYLDLARPDLSHLPLAGVRQAVILAAEPNVARCEQDPDRARAVNVEGTLSLIEQLSARQIKPIFASTDYVFDGERGMYGEADPTEPSTVYGRQKEEIERALLTRSDGTGLVMRFSKVYSLTRGDGTLFDEMAQNLVAGRPVRAASDQVFCPIWIDDLCRAVQAVQRADLSGIVHLCGDQARTRLSMARTLTRALGLSEDLVVPISLDDLGTTPKRPKNTSMRNERLRGIYRQPMMRPDTAVKAVAENYLSRD